MMNTSVSEDQLMVEAKRLTDQRAYAQVWQLLSAIPRDQLIRNVQLCMLGIGALSRLYLQAEARALIRESSPYFQASGDSNALRRWQNAYATHALYEGSVREALNYAQHSLTSAELDNDQRVVAFSSNILGVITSTVGDLASAMRFYNRSIAAWQLVGDPHGVGLGHYNLAVALREWDQFEAATKHFFLAQEYVAESGTDEELIMMGIERTQLLIALGDLQLADASARATIHRAQMKGNSYLEVGGLRVLGAVRLAAYHLEEAQELLELSAGKYAQMPNRPLEVEVHEDLTVLALRAHRWSDAEELQKRVSDWYRSFGAEAHALRFEARCQSERRAAEVRTHTTRGSRGTSDRKISRIEGSKDPQSFSMIDMASSLDKGWR